jgi:hypothetical protein
VADLQYRDCALPAILSLLCVSDSLKSVERPSRGVEGVLQPPISVARSLKRLRERLKESKLNRDERRYFTFTTAYCGTAARET